MIRKIIASDIDGTLLPFGTENLDPELFNVIEDLKKKDILFVPASGRTIRNLHELFEPVKEDLSYLSENGGAVWHFDKQIGEFPIPRKQLNDVYETIKNHPFLEGYANAPLNAYSIIDTLVDGSLLKRPFSPAPEKVETLSDIPDTIVKFTAMCIDGHKAEEFFPKLLKTYEKSLDVAMAGPDVIDFCSTNKGMGLKLLTEYMNLSPQDVFAMGDNYNDLPMLKYAGTSYMMDTDDPVRREAASFIINDPIKEIKNLYMNL